MGGGRRGGGDSTTAQARRGDLIWCHDLLCDVFVVTVQSMKSIKREKAPKNKELVQWEDIKARSAIKSSTMDGLVECIGLKVHFFGLFVDCLMFVNGGPTFGLVDGTHALRRSCR